MTNVLQFFNNIYNNWVIWAQYNVIYLDFKKTFDMTTYNKLIFRLLLNRIGGHLYSWIGDWLSDR